MYQNGACYIRVSTDEQTEFSPAAQMRALNKYAKDNGIVIAKNHIFIDEGISGKRADKRPAFMHMVALAKIKPKPFDVILVHKFDRFARSREDSVVYKSLLKREAGVKVISITESIDDDKFSVILEAMLEAMAEYYSLNLADEVKKGMTEKALKGELQSTPSFGYRAENNQLIIIPEEARYVRFIFEQFANRKMGMRSLAIYLNDMGVKTHRGNLFETRSIEYILNNPVYIGKLRWTPSGRTYRKYHNPNTIVGDSSHEHIVSQELWSRVQDVVKETRNTYKPRTRSQAPLRSWLKGLVCCGQCGKLLTATNSKSFQCNGYSKGLCQPSSSISIKKLEEIVLNQLKSTFDYCVEIDTAASNHEAETVCEHDLLAEKLRKLELREERIKLAFQDGIDTAEEYKASKQSVARERKTILLRREKMTQSVSGREITQGIRMKFENVYALLVDENISMETKLKAATFLIRKIVYTKSENRMSIEYCTDI